MSKFEELKADTIEETRDNFFIDAHCIVDKIEGAIKDFKTGLMSISELAKLIIDDALDLDIDCEYLGMYDRQLAKRKFEQS